MFGKASTGASDDIQKATDLAACRGETLEALSGKNLSSEASNAVNLTAFAFPLSCPTGC
jgi:hypothetical protein